MDVLDSRTNRVYRTGAKAFVVVPTGRKAVPETWKDTKTDDHFDFGGGRKVTVNGIVTVNTKTPVGKSFPPKLVRMTDGFFTLHVNPVLFLAAMLAVRAPGRGAHLTASKQKPYMQNMPILGVEGPGGLAIVALVKTG
jgi:hypothetical protein